MRRNLATVLITLGAFLLLSALLVRFYAYPKLAIVPVDQDSVTHLEASDATIFSIGDLREIQTDLSIAATTRGDVEATEEAGGETRVWAGTTTVEAEDGTIVSQSTDRTAFNGTTAEAINCCGNFQESSDGERVAISPRGLVFKFPFNTQKKTYEVWDDSVGEAVEAEFVEEDTIKGLPVYVFKQVIDRTAVGTREVPASIVGEEGDEPVVADAYYANTRTFYIEPETGATINRIEEQDSTLAVDGEDRVTTTRATIHYTDDQVAKMVKDIKPTSQQLGAIRSIAPLVAGILGLILLVIGFVLGRRKERSNA